MDIIRPYLARVLAAPIAALCAWLLMHWQVNITTDTQAQLVTALVAFILPFFGIVYAIVHKILDKWINPADAATTTLAAQGKAAQVRRV